MKDGSLRLPTDRVHHGHSLHGVASPWPSLLRASRSRPRPAQRLATSLPSARVGRG
uniref:Uncharacterized protein n=1 Tax=Anguilla anguilla TaxID=7936 RepID=A0A0E9W178_ANGAN